ncbi:hypothetical protein C8J57DRAFT_326164 [Mycena rebaudengoi]|nr:hypothetical protein C8J57DRAFT_326164 [Mycena rebaudengoi]
MIRYKTGTRHSRRVRRRDGRVGTWGTTFAREVCSLWCAGGGHEHDDMRACERAWSRAERVVRIFLRPSACPMQHATAYTASAAVRSRRRQIDPVLVVLAVFRAWRVCAERCGMWVRRRRGGCGVPRSASGCGGRLTPGALDLGPSSMSLTASRSSSAYPSFISTGFEAYTLRRAEAARLRFRAYPPGACSIACVLSWRCFGSPSYSFAPRAQHGVDTSHTSRPPTEQFGLHSCLVVHPRLLPLRHLSIPSLLPFCSFASTTCVVSAPSHPFVPPLPLPDPRPSHPRPPYPARRRPHASPPSSTPFPFLSSCLLP